MNHNAASWNPLRCSGTELQPQALLLAKLLALVYWRFGIWRHLPEPFNPFLPFLSSVAGPAYLITLKAVLMAAFLCIWFNRRVREACLVAGIGILLATLSSRTYYEDNTLFTGCVFFLLGLAPRGGTPWLLRLQVVLLYFGAGSNKLTDPDWRSGQFFAAWAPRYIVQPIYFHLATAFPGELLATAISRVTIATELFLSGAFLVPALYPVAIWVGLLFHSSSFWLTDREFGIFVYAIALSYLAFVEWPERVTVLYDGTCGFCSRTRKWMERLDLEGRFCWVPFQNASSLFGISEKALERRLHIVTQRKTGKRIESGYAAFRKMLLYSPLTYFFLFGLLTERQFPGFHYRKWLAMALVLLFSPLVNPVGEAVYDWIAKNRHRIPGGQFCPLPRNFPDLHAKARGSISVTPADESSSAGPVGSIGRQQ